MLLRVDDWLHAVGHLWGAEVQVAWRIRGCMLHLLTLGWYLT